MRLIPALFLLLICSARATAQTAPPIQGVTGTIATDETIEAEHHAGGVIADGVRRVADQAKKILHFGGKGTPPDPLSAFAGRRVVIRDGAERTEGTVIDVNRGRQQITIRIADRKTVTLRTADPSAAATESPLVVSYTDDAGATVSRDFTRVS
ncbi:MAG: hypothetical protein JWL71_2148 [Acidobacteria bacterium]|nr:hypothetical protein [Acidobacteriota bacterium]